MNTEIKSAGRVLDVLEMFSTRCDGFTLSEVARDLDLPKSSTLGLLRTLHQRGYLIREDENDTYRINDLIRRDGFARHGLILRVVPPVMQALARSAGETGLLGMLDTAGQARLLASELAPSDIRFDIEAPRRLPAYASAIGRILMSRLPTPDVEAMLDAAPRAALTPATRVERGAILDAIAAARETGFAIVEDEFCVGGTELAAAIAMPEGQPSMALSLACLSQRYRSDTGRLQALLSAAVTETAEAMARQGRP
ncbi:IclR family transcriptional regulator [Novosphingobium gossypii]|uniref:IclR family transcriptional regulator n=1 Tax=Novosphingobium gossypii TaxID=1604774 RepID=UPI003D23ED5E